MSDVQSILSKRLLRINQVLALVPVGKSSWWEGCRTGRFPKPIKLAPRTTVWRVEDITALVKRFGNSDESKEAL